MPQKMRGRGFIATPDELEPAIRMRIVHRARDEIFEWIQSRHPDRALPPAALQVFEELKKRRGNIVRHHDRLNAPSRVLQSADFHRDLQKNRKVPRHHQKERIPGCGNPPRFFPARVNRFPEKIPLQCFLPLLKRSLLNPKRFRFVLLKMPNVNTLTDFFAITFEKRKKLNGVGLKLKPSQ